jgi:hypothetical protein
MAGGLSVRVGKAVNQRPRDRTLPRSPHALVLRHHQQILSRVQGEIGDATWKTDVARLGGNVAFRKRLVGCRQRVEPNIAGLRWGLRRHDTDGLIVSLNIPKEMVSHALVRIPSDLVAFYVAKMSR